MSPELLYEPRLHELAKGSCSGPEQEGAKPFETEAQRYVETSVGLF